MLPNPQCDTDRGGIVRVPTDQRGALEPARACVILHPALSPQSDVKAT